MTHVLVVAMCLICSSGLLSAELRSLEAPAIAIFLNFDKNPAPALLQEMQREVAAIMKPAGLHFDWRELNNPRGDESFADLVVVHFRGSCNMSSPLAFSELGPAGSAPSLASTNISNGRVLPFSEVECDHLRHYIAPQLPADTTDAQRELLLGRAMARVLSHELYHIFAATKKHAHDGIARSFHTRKELLARDFALAPKDAATLHDLKWRALLAGEAKTPEIAALR